MKKEKWILDQLLDHITENKRKLFQEIIEYRTNHVTVALENIFQPHNAAAVLRSCDCFGVQNVHVIENGNKYTPNKEIDMGSSKWISMNRYNQEENNTLNCINQLKSKGYKIVATTPHEKDCMIDELPLDQPVALLFGTELTGLSDIALEHSDAYVKLPMYGFTESYNISVSVALALFSVTERMRKDSSIKWELSEEEKILTQLAWAEKVVKHPQKVRAVYEQKFNDSQVP